MKLHNSQSRLLAIAASCVFCVSSYAAPVIAPIGAMTVYVQEPVRFTVKATEQGKTLTYSVTGLPAGAAINASTGQFAWHPAIGDTGVRTAAFRASDGSAQSVMNVPITVVMPRLAAGEYIKTLRPNGGEVYTYGDSMNIAFITVGCCPRAQIRIQKGAVENSRTSCFFTNGSGSELFLNGDTIDERGLACRYYFPLGTQGVNLGFYRIALVDTEVLSCRNPINFGGDSVRADSNFIKVFNQYGTETSCPADQGTALAMGDLSNAPFSVLGRTGVINAQIRHLRPQGLWKGPLSIYTGSGRFLFAAEATMSARLPAGVYVVKAQSVSGAGFSATVALSKPGSITDLIGSR
jgi:hypothetical protein